MKQLINNLDELLEGVDSLKGFSQLLQLEGTEWYEADQHYVQELQLWTRSVDSVLRLAGQDKHIEAWQQAIEVEISVANVYNYADRLRVVLKQIKSTLEQDYDYAPNLAKVVDTPFLSPSDISGAYKMAELYIVLHCYENSVRQFIETIFLGEIGEDWWEQVASQNMKEHVNGRKNKEQQQRWLSPRGGASPLYYLEWGDLVKLIRKKDSLFLPYIGDLRFVESRFEDLESLRNIVAHNGVLPSDDDFQRVIISFRDWGRQVSQFHPETVQA